MNWKKALLVFVGLVVAFVLIVSAVVGLVAMAGVIAVAESGLVDSVVDGVIEVVDDGERVEIELNVPRVTVTDLDSGRRQEIVPNFDHVAPRLEQVLPRFEQGAPHFEQIVPRLDRRFDRVVISGRDRVDFWPGFVLAPLGLLLRSIVTVVALGMVALGAWLLLRNRQPAEKKSSGE